MATETPKIDQLIGRLYQSTNDIDIGHFRTWALNELQGLIEFDACIWSTGHLSTRSFHTHSLIGLEDGFPERLVNSLPINPISKHLFYHPCEPVDMADVVDDETFYQSDIYQLVFKPAGIERILSSIHIDSRSGIYTLLTLYRSERSKRFTQDEKTLHQRILFHLINAASMAGFASLEESNNTQLNSHAICDQHGVYHAVESTFLDLIEEAYPDHSEQILPFSVPIFGEKTIHRNLLVKCEVLGELRRISIRNTTPIDQLTQREKEVVDGVTQGLSFKQIAKTLGLSPSTISNHLYRVYQKLNINNRSELADLMKCAEA